MKQAILITAYRDIGFINKIIEALDENYTYYIHLDRKQQYDGSLLSSLKEHQSVRLLSRQFRVNWGSIQHLEAILHLVEEALKDNETEYMHLITGQDFPVKSSEAMTAFLREHVGKEYITGSRLPDKKWKNGGIERIGYYNFYEAFNGKNRGRLLIKGLVLLQKKLGINRSLPKALPTLYGGTTYWTLSRNALKYIKGFLASHPEIMKRFRYTFCAEEIVIHSILMQDNSPFRNRIAQNNLRYIIWQHRDGHYPANLDERDWHDIQQTDAFFARKFAFPVSAKLCKLIEESVFNK